MLIAAAIVLLAAKVWLCIAAIQAAHRVAGEDGVLIFVALVILSIEFSVERSK